MTWFFSSTIFILINPHPFNTFDSSNRSIMTDRVILKKKIQAKKSAIKIIFVKWNEIKNKKKLMPIFISIFSHYLPIHFIQFRFIHSVSVELINLNGCNIFFYPFDCWNNNNNHGYFVNRWSTIIDYIDSLLQITFPFFFIFLGFFIFFFTAFIVMTMMMITKEFIEFKGNNSLGMRGKWMIQFVKLKRNWLYNSSCYYYPCRIFTWNDLQKAIYFMLSSIEFVWWFCFFVS